MTYRWDNWIAWFDGDQRYHRFSLAAPRSLSTTARHGAARIHHWTSTDLEAWSGGEQVVEPDPARDEIATWTGCAAQINDALYLFYTGTHGPRREQRVRAAVSHDGQSFERLEPIILAPEPGPGYCVDEADGIISAWRDPFVFEGEGGQLHMLFAAKRPDRAPMGCVGHAVAHVDDPLRWTLRPPLELPESYLQIEVPTILRRDGWLYCFVSTKDQMTDVDEVDNLAIRVYRARDLEGPWEVLPPLLDWRAGLYGLVAFEGRDGRSRMAGFTTAGIDWSPVFELRWSEAGPALVGGV